MIVLPCLLAAAALAAPADAPRFSSSVDQVRVDVAVSRGDEPITGLTAEDFEVLDDGVPQRIEIVAREQDDVHAVLVFDLSSSLSAADRVALRDAALHFLRKLDPTDHATLLTFTHDLRLATGPGSPASVIDSLQSFESLQDSGATALYDAVFAGMTLAGTAPGRAFVIVFTDGVNLISALSPEAMLEAARRLESTVYLVSRDEWPEPPETIVQFVPMGADDVPSRRPQSSSGWVPVPSRQAMARVVSDTGGRLWTGRSIGQLRADFARVLAEVKKRYLIAYEQAAEPRPGWHEIKVRLKNRRGDVLVRRGYWVP